MNERPMMYVFAGNNGSGKSTFRSLLIDKLGIEINIDPDAIARRLDPLNPESKRLAAGRKVLELVSECINERKSFSIETTLSGNNAIKQIKEAKDNGFEVTMFFLGLKDVNKNIERVALRVKNGGHDIPTKDILRRHTRSLENLIQNIEHVDNLLIVDNSNLDGELIIETSQGFITYQSNHVPQWVNPIISKLK